MATTTPAFVQPIIDSFGGLGKLKSMVGAEHFGFDTADQSFSFRFKKCKKANHVKVALTGDDLYTMTFTHIPSMKAMMNGAECEMVERYEMIYNNQVKDLFERFTGLYLSL